MQASGSLELQTCQLNIMNGFEGGIFCVCVFPPPHSMITGKTGGLFARSSPSVNIMICYLLSSTPPTTCSVGYFPFIHLLQLYGDVYLL